MNKALCVGMNDYPGTVNDLSQCVNDMQRWKHWLESHGFIVGILWDSGATIANIANELKRIIVDSVAGDHLVFTYSGHGSQELDMNGDEADGYDEVICLYDGDLSDDGLRFLFNQLPVGVGMTVILDSCFSGTATRAFHSQPAVARFRPPKRYIRPSVRRKKAFLSDENMPEVLLSGCGENEYSYEGPNGGAFTNAALDILNALDPASIDYFDFAEEMARYLPTSYFPQSPQVEGSSANKSKIMFGLKAAPVPEPDEDEGWCTCFRRIKLAYRKLKRRLK